MSRSHIADMRKIFDKKKTTESQNPDKVKKLPVKKPAPKIEEKSLIPPNQKPKIIENSEIISKENQDMIIYKYPKIQIKDSKIILLIGYNPEEFINSFINVYSDINYEDKFRYKIEASNSNDSYKLYNIKARSTNYDLKIISMQSSKKNIDFIKNLLNIFYKEKIIDFISCIFITLEEKNHLNNIGIISFLLLIILFKYENLKDRINIIYSSENSLYKNLNENQEQNNNNKIILHEYFNNPAIIKIYNPKYFFINNNTLYETNKENEYKR